MIIFLFYCTEEKTPLIINLNLKKIAYDLKLLKKHKHIINFLKIDNVFFYLMGSDVDPICSYIIRQLRY